MEYIVKARLSDLFGITNKGELIRCKDCKWAVTIGCGLYVCRQLVSGKHHGEWFCADGEAKAGEQE